MGKPYGKNIKLQKKDNDWPSNQTISPRKLNRFKQLNKTVKTTQHYWKGRNPSTGYTAGAIDGAASSTKRGFNTIYTPAYTNPFYLFLCDNAICRIGDKIKPGTVTSIDISNPSGHLGSDLLRKGDYFWLYNTITYKSIRLQCDLDLADNATNVRIASTVFKFSDNYPPGSIIVPDYKVQTQRLSNVPLLKKIELNLTQYQNLASTPLVLLAAETDVLHIPFNATIIYKHDADEMTQANLYIGHNAPSTTVGRYWASIKSAFYRSRDPQLLQVSPGIYGAGISSNYNYIATKSDRNNGVGLALKLYGSANFTSTSTFTILLYYKSIAV